MQDPCPPPSTLLLPPSRESLHDEPLCPRRHPTHDPQAPTASIMAVRLGVIQAVGNSLHQVLRAAQTRRQGQELQPRAATVATTATATGDDGEVVLHDLQGRFVMPVSEGWG